MSASAPLLGDNLRVYLSTMSFEKTYHEAIERLGPGNRAIDTPSRFGTFAVVYDGVSPLLRKRDRNTAKWLFNVTHLVVKKFPLQYAALKASIADIRPFQRVAKPAFDFANIAIARKVAEDRGQKLRVLPNLRKFEPAIVRAELNIDAGQLARFRPACPAGCLRA
jgi:hypothetical protein